jgi:hypothetical protein
MKTLHSLGDLPQSMFSPEDEARKFLDRMLPHIERGGMFTMGFVTNVLRRACRGVPGAYDKIRGTETWRVVQSLCI